MGRLLERGLAQAGLSELAARALLGQGLAEPELERLRKADVLLVAGLADAVRARHRGDEVRLYSPEALRRAQDLVRVEPRAGGASGPTGQEILVEIALGRLATPGHRSICVSYEQLGLQLAQTALVFGADALWGDLSTQRTLPLLDGASARRTELTGLIERAGRRARFVALEPEALESRS
jgi:hypothetical protein